MTTLLSEEERAVWKDAYRLHESVHDMTGTEKDWELFCKHLVELVNQYTGSERRLATKIMLALYDYMSEEQKIRQDAEGLQPEQVVMEGIPWT